MFGYANPTRFMALSGAILPWAVALTCGVMAYGLYLAFNAPPDYQQKETVRIMFVHVPAAWMAMFVYTAIAVASAVALIWKHPLADVAAKSAAPIGACFTLLALMTGSLWGKPMWNTWWVWDARLTSVFVLFLLYLGYIAIWQAIEEPVRAGRIAAILAMVGFVIIPIIKFSVDWWNTLHQPASVLKFGGTTLHAAFLVPLLVMAAGYTALFVVLHLIGMRSEILKRRIRSMRLAQADQLR